MAVNVSPRQFQQPDFVERVNIALEQSGANPACLTLELTEGVVIVDVEDAIEKMRALKASGVHFSIDDFGTGYSSLAYLTRLPLDQLKVAQSFMQGVTDHPADATIVGTIIAMARHLNLDVVAEGVETQAQYRFLQGTDCRVYQGFYFGRPVSAEKFHALLQ